MGVPSERRKRVGKAGRKPDVIRLERLRDLETQVLMRGGFSPRLAAEIAERHHVNVEQVELDWAALQVELRDLAGQPMALRYGIHKQLSLRLLEQALRVASDPDVPQRDRSAARKDALQTLQHIAVIDGLAGPSAVVVHEHHGEVTHRAEVAQVTGPTPHRALKRLLDTGMTLSEAMRVEAEELALMAEQFEHGAMMTIDAMEEAGDGT